MATLTRKALKLGIVAGTLPAAAIALGYRTRAVQASENTQEGSRIYKTCDLPIYNVGNTKGGGDISENEEPRNALMEQIRSIRISVTDILAQYKETYEEAKQTVETGVAHSKSTLDFVQNNPGELPRVAFITVGSLGGFILGYRGGIFRKLVYGTVAGVSCAALCYPQSTLELSQQASRQLQEGLQGFSTDELMKGNWPFLYDLSTDEENRKKLDLNDVVSVVKEVSNDVTSSSSSLLPPVGTKGDPGQANPDDKDMYSTRTS